MAGKVFMQATELLVSSQSRSIRQKAGVISIYPKQVEKLKKHKGSKQTAYFLRNKRSSFETKYNPEDLEFDEQESLAHSITTFGSHHLRDEAEREKNEELQRFRAFVKAKTLQNRFFKPPKTPDLLTWACKERMRFLHAEDPDEWCSEALAETFPVSHASVKEILKSRIRLLTVIDILDHDLHVKRNWEKILSSLTSKSRSCVNEEVEQVLSNIGEEDNLLNILSFRKEKGILSFRKQKVPSRKKLGTFSSLVQDELEKKEEENTILRSKHEEQLRELKKTLFNIRIILLDYKQHESNVPDVKVDSATLSEIQKDQRKYKAQNDPIEIHISDEEMSHSKSIIDGCVYGEHGEFLYRIP